MTNTTTSIVNQIVGSYAIRERQKAVELVDKARFLGLKVDGPDFREFTTPTFHGYAYGVKITDPNKEKSDTTRARSTGTLVTLCEGDDLPWMLICEEHAGCMEFETKAEAQAHRPHPDTWCEWCMGNEEVES